jgi:hypothetical protein
MHWAWSTSLLHWASATAWHSLLSSMTARDEALAGLTSMTARAGKRMVNSSMPANAEPASINWLVTAGSICS